MQRQREGWHQILDLGGTPLEMVWIPPGEFLMGSPTYEKGRYERERPQHQVTFADGFWMGRYPVTQAQWKWVAGLRAIAQTLNTDPSEFKGANRPVEQVSWENAQEFCRRLSLGRSQLFQLPSEAQWEYACRGGTKMPFAVGETLTTTLANYDGNYAYGQEPKGGCREGTTAVGQFPANRWGLQDMHGNVWEWCEDTWHDDYEGAPTDGTPWITDKLISRPIRGGSWDSNPRYCRSASRFKASQQLRVAHLGFRVVCSSAQGERGLQS